MPHSPAPANCLPYAAVMDERCTHSEGVIKNGCGNSPNIHCALSCECRRQTVPLPASPTGLWMCDLHVRRAANVWRGNSNHERVSPMKRTAAASWSSHSCSSRVHAVGLRRRRARPISRRRTRKLTMSARCAHGMCVTRDLLHSDKAFARPASAWRLQVFPNSAASVGLEALPPAEHLPFA